MTSASGERLGERAKADRRIGCQEPQTRIVPAAIGTSADELLPFCREVVGMRFDPWQELALRDALGERFDEEEQARRWAAFIVELLAVRQVGKGVVLEARGMGGVHVLGERRVVWSTVRGQTASEALSRMRVYYDGVDELRRQVRRVLDNTNEKRIELYGRRRERLTGSRQIMFVTRTKHSARGLSGECVFLDEAYGVTRTQIGALVPILATLPDPQLWLTSTPPLDDVLTEAKTDPENAIGLPLYDIRERALAGDPEVMYYDWSPPFHLDQVEREDAERVRDGRPRIKEDRDLWYRSVPALGIRIREGQVRRETIAMSTRQFCRERLGCWPPAPKMDKATKAITDKVWRDLARPYAVDDPSQVPDPVSLGIDAAPGREYGAIMLYGDRDDGLGQVETIEYRIGIDWIPERLVELVQDHDPVAVTISRRGPAASIIGRIKALGIVEPQDRVDQARHDAGGKLTIEELDELRQPKRGDLVVTSAEDDANATAQFIDAANGGLFVHLDDPDLNAEVEGAATRDIGDGSQAWGRRSSKRPIPRLFGATLARYGHLLRAGAVLSQVEYDPVANIR